MRNRIKIGDHFGTMTVIGEVRDPSINGAGRHRRWSLRCDCGKITSATTNNLLYRQPKSCGCLTKSILSEARRTHGLRNDPLYKTWNSMKTRCYNQKARDYGNYGGRGIKVCDRWQDFANFYADMAPKPSPQHQLDRKDNDADYSPENCHWVLPITNASNRRSSVPITYKGETKSAVEWARQFGLPSYIVARRLRAGWSIDKLFDPIQPQFVHSHPYTGPGRPRKP